MALLYGTYGPDQKYVDDWKVPSNRAFMHDPADQAFWQKSSQQEASDLANVWGGQDPFTLALGGRSGAASSRAPAAPQPYTPPPFSVSQAQPQPSLWQPPSTSAPSPAPTPAPQTTGPQGTDAGYQAPTSQPLMPPSFGVAQQQPTQQGSVLGQMTPKPYQPTNFSAPQRTTQSPTGAASSYRSNPAFAAYSRSRGL